MHDTNLLEDQPIAWTPTPDVIERSQLTKFMRQVGVSTWEELYAFSVRDVEKFTEEVLKFLDIKFDPPYEKVLDTSGGIEFPRWFAGGFPQSRKDAKEAQAETRAVASVPLSEPGAIATGSPDGDLQTSDSSELPPRRRNGGTPPKQGGDLSSHESEPGAVATGSLSHAGLNITEMCLDRWQTDEMKDQPAVIFEGEKSILEEDLQLGNSYFAKGTESYWDNAFPETLTYGELANRVELFAAAMRAEGLGKGDAIGIHLPMVPETIISLLAIGRIGAIAVPVFSGYGVLAIEARLTAVEARALITCDGFPRRGRYVAAFESALEAVKNTPCLRKVFVLTRYGRSDELTPLLDAEDGFYFDLGDAIWSGEQLPEPLGSPEPTSAEDPLIILYTSGTTGKPKGIAHTHA
nr:AMP-binding protein [Blastocatellia bacterium]